MNTASAEQRPPTCAVCGHQVENFTWWHDPLKQERVFVAECHGEREVSTLSESELMNADRVRLSIGKAFVGAPALPQGKR